MAKSVVHAKPAAAQPKGVKKAKKVAGGPVERQRRRGGYVSQKSERGSGLKFSVEDYATAARFTPGTRIKYGPNPKTRGSKSFDRYAAYCKAKTVGESLKLGTKPADLLWELNRGDYKVLGGARSEAQEIAAIGKAAYDKAIRVIQGWNGPAGCPVKFTDPDAVEKLKKEEDWRSDRLARVQQRGKALKLKVETTEEIDASTESADIRLQRRVAEGIAKQCLASGKKITDADVNDVLTHWGFSENIARLNVMPENMRYVYSDTIGAIRARSKGFGSTPPTKRYPLVAKLLCQWLKDNKPKVGSARFVCTAINLNCNYAGRRHRDQNNEGPSVIRAFGKFKGGKLVYFPKDVKKAPRPAVDTLDPKDSVSYDLAKTNVVFNGTRAHQVESFEGERYSVVYFTASGYQKGKPQDVEFLKKSCGFPFPTPADLGALKKATEDM